MSIVVSFSLGQDTSLLANILPDMYLFGIIKQMLHAAGTILAAIDEVRRSMSQPSALINNDAYLRSLSCRSTAAKADVAAVVRPREYV